MQVATSPGADVQEAAVSQGRGKPQAVLPLGSLVSGAGVCSRPFRTPLGAGPPSGLGTTSSMRMARSSK